MLLFLCIFDRRCKFKSRLWKKPLVAVLENGVLKTPRKIPLQEVEVYSSLFSKGCKFTKNELLHGYFSKILPRFEFICFQEHLAVGTSFNGCFCIYVFQWLLNDKLIWLRVLLELKKFWFNMRLFCSVFSVLSFNIVEITTFRGNLCESMWLAPQ